MSVFSSDNSFKGFSIPILSFSYGNNSTEFYGRLGGTITFDTAEYSTLSISTVETSYEAANNPGHGITPAHSSAPNLHICSGETDISTLVNGNKNIILDISGYETITMEVRSGLCASGTVHLTEVTFKQITNSDNYATSCTITIKGYVTIEMRWGTPWYSCGTKNGNFTLVIENGEVSSCTIGNAYIFSPKGSGSWDYEAKIVGMTITSITIEQH